jgi:hypothetical protein
MEANSQLKMWKYKIVFGILGNDKESCAADAGQDLPSASFLKDEYRHCRILDNS